jgi:hypothetical protein
MMSFELSTEIIDLSAQHGDIETFKRTLLLSTVTVPIKFYVGRIETFFGLG